MSDNPEPTDIPIPRLLTATDVQRVLGVCERSFRVWRRKGIFPRADIAIGRSTRRWKQETVLKWIADRLR